MHHDDKTNMCLNLIRKHVCLCFRSENLTPLTNNMHSKTLFVGQTEKFSDNNCKRTIIFNIKHVIIHTVRILSCTIHPILHRVFELLKIPFLVVGLDLTGHEFQIPYANAKLLPLFRYQSFQNTFFTI